MKQITAICEMEDQASGIEDIRIIDYTQEAMDAYYEQMEEFMGVYGFQVHYYSIEYPHDIEGNETLIYRWMNENEDYRIEEA